MTTSNGISKKLKRYCDSKKGVELQRGGNAWGKVSNGDVTSANGRDASGPHCDFLSIDLPYRPTSPVLRYSKTVSMVMDALFGEQRQSKNAFVCCATFGLAISYSLVHPTIALALTQLRPRPLSLHVAARELLQCRSGLEDIFSGFRPNLDPNVQRLPV